MWALPGDSRSGDVISWLTTAEIKLAGFLSAWRCKTHRRCRDYELQANIWEIVASFYLECFLPFSLNQTRIGGEEAAILRPLHCGVFTAQQDGPGQGSGEGTHVESLH